MNKIILELGVLFTGNKQKKNSNFFLSKLLEIKLKLNFIKSKNYSFKFKKKCKKKKNKKR